MTHRISSNQQHKDRLKVSNPQQLTHDGRGLTQKVDNRSEATFQRKLQRIVQRSQEQIVQKNGNDENTSGGSKDSVTTKHTYNENSRAFTVDFSEHEGHIVVDAPNGIAEGAEDVKVTYTYNSTVGNTDEIERHTDEPIIADVSGSESGFTLSWVSEGLTNDENTRSKYAYALKFEHGKFILNTSVAD